MNLFALTDPPNETTSLVVNFMAGGVRHLYEVELSRDAVELERLSAWTSHRKSMWFERITERVKFGAHFAGENELLRTQMRSNSLFLSVGAQNNHKKLLPAYQWFQRTVFRPPTFSAMRGASDIATTPEYGDELLTVRPQILEMLRAADTGIIDLEIKELPREPTADAPIGLRRRFTVRSKHEGAAAAWLPFAAESNGTRTMFNLASNLAKPLAHGGVVFIDELERALHPMLAMELVRSFQDPQRNPKGAQLIFTTHDTNLLSPASGPIPLRRDQIWFTEKSREGATSLYPLTDFHPRDGENFERGYLQGRFGAIPYLGNVALNSTNDSTSRESRS